MKSFLCTIFVLSIFYSGYGETTDMDSISVCGDNGWVAYKDEKCFKLIQKFRTRDEAEEICNKECLKTVSFVPTLASIKSADEQHFLATFIFDTSGVRGNVWIGAKRTENGNQFVWNDGSSINFTNWAEGSPSEEIERVCVEMQSRFTKQFSNISNLDNHAINGKWKDVTCESGYYFVCQKLQTWSFIQLQNAFLDARKELRDSLEDTKNRLGDAKNKIEDLQRNPVPIGFIYAQLPGQPEPTDLWPTVQWGDVSSEYAGLFFRVVGGGAEPFGTLQNGNAPLRYIDSVLFTPTNDGNFARWGIDLPNSGQSEHIWSGTWDSSHYASLSFHVSENGGEVRPINKAARIWKRTS